MQETYGRELFTTYRDKINFGLNIHIWRNLLGSILGPEKYFSAGWSGVLEKRLGCLTLNFKKEWDSLTTPKASFIVIWKPILLFKRISKWRSFNSEIKIKRQRGKFINVS